MLLDKVKLFIEKYKLQNSKLIVAVSGGIDSICMLHALNYLELNLIVAHCNFQLRGSESDMDELFVNDYSKELGLPFYSKRFETKLFCEQQKVSTQMGARTLRYEWFEELKTETNANFLATGATKNDNIETFLINFGRGSGISGLSGIAKKTNFLIRPLLNVSKSEVLKYKTENNLIHREDKSNQSTDYIRNAIRHKVITELQSIFPEFENTATNTITHLNETEKFINAQISAIQSNLCSHKGKQLSIDIYKLNKEPEPRFVLFHILKDYGFNSSQIDNLLSTTENDSGKLFESSTHYLIRNRNEFLVEKKEKNTDKKLTISELTREIPDLIKFSSFDSSEVEIEKTKEKAFLDFDKLTFP